MAVMGHVAKLWRYPASSLGGEGLTAMTVDASGAQGDRLFGLVDAATGEIALAAKGTACPALRRGSWMGSLK